MKLAIDPGSNKCGLAWFKDGWLVAYHTVKTSKETPESRRLDVSVLLSQFIREVESVICEAPMLLGRNNNGMQRLLGMIEYICHINMIPLEMIHPMTVKKRMGAASGAKIDLALAVGQFLPEADQELLAELINEERWDETDAIAIGLCGLGKGVKKDEQV